MTKMRKISLSFSISLISLILLAGAVSANKKKGVATPQGNDLSKNEIRAVTIESWDCERDGIKYGWEVITDKDSDYHKLSQYPSQGDGAKYNPELPASSQAFRRVKTVPGKPQNLKSRFGEKGGDKDKLLAVKFQFTYPGYHEVTIRPPRVNFYKIERVRGYYSENNLEREDYKKQVEERRAKNAKYDIYGIELPGIVKGLSVWVLGRGNNYELEGWVEDWKGETHVVRFGSVNFVGWRPLVAKVPSYIPQDTDSFPQIKTLVFKQFKLRSTPKTSGEMVYLYMDEFKVLTDIFDVHFDGAEINFDDDDKKSKLKTDKMLERLEKSLKCEAVQDEASSPAPDKDQPKNP